MGCIDRVGVLVTKLQQNSENSTLSRCFLEQSKTVNYAFNVDSARNSKQKQQKNLAQKNNDEKFNWDNLICYGKTFHSSLLSF